MARRLSSPVLIGREAELHAFERSIDEALHGRTAILILGGEAGAGKTRLVAEFVARTRTLGGVAGAGTAPPPAGAARAPWAALTPANEQPLLDGAVDHLDREHLYEEMLHARRMLQDGVVELHGVHFRRAPLSQD